MGREGVMLHRRVCGSRNLEQHIRKNSPNCASTQSPVAYRCEPAPRRVSVPFGAVARTRGDKDFSDVLGPVFGYLRKHCGRPWDAVFSELAQVLGSGSYPIRHVLHDHILRPMRQGYGDFEIDGHGILRELPRTRWRWRPENEPLREITVGENRCYLKINRLWYLAATRICPLVSDPEWPVKRVNDGYRMVEHKKQLNKKELRDLFRRPEFAQC